MLRKLLLACFAFMALMPVSAQNTCPSWGPYVTSGNFATGGELLYTEVMSPQGSPNSIYWSTINFQIGPRGGYSGIQRHGDGSRWCIFSIWDLIDDNNAHECHAEYAVPGSIVEGFGNEGTGIHGLFNMNWTPDYWYSTVIRRWYTGDNQTRAGFFMYDYSTGKWYHYFTFVTPETNATFQGNGLSGFLENFNAAGNNYATSVGYYRNSWAMNSTGQFSKPAYYQASAGAGGYWNGETAFNNTAVKVTSCGTGQPPASYPSFTLNQSGTKPPPSTPATVTSVVPTYANSHVTVNWAISEYASPQLSYTVKIHGSGGLYTPPLVTVQGIRPDTRTITCPLPAGSPTGTYWVSVQVTDIFNQVSNLGYASMNVNAVPTAGINTNIYYKIRNVYSGQYLDIENGATTDAAYITQQYTSTATSQQWRFQKVGANYLLINRKSGKLLTIAANIQSAGAPLIQYVMSNTPVTQYNQQWNMVEGPAGIYQVISGMSQQMLMCNPGWSDVNGAKMIIYPANVPVGTHQQWILEPVSNTLTAQAYAPLLAEGQESEQIQTYPNPVEKGMMLRFNLPVSENGYKLNIKTLTGANVMDAMLSNAHSEIATDKLVPGVYLFQINGNEKSFNGKFIVQ